MSTFRCIAWLFSIMVLLITPSQHAIINHRMDLSMLTREEDLALRSVIYSDGLSTSIDEKDSTNQTRIVVVPARFRQLYDTKRDAVLHLLLDILKGGYPDDAITAAGIAIALEESPRSAVRIARQSEANFDQDKNQLGKTPRQKLIDWLETQIKKKVNGRPTAY